MARPATGSVVIDTRRPDDPAFGIRFRAAGKRRFATLGRASEGWTEGRAEQELADTLALVRKGLWRPPEPPPPAKTCQRRQHSTSSRRNGSLPARRKDSQRRRSR